MKKIIALLFLTPIAANAVPIAYDEGVDGDLVINSSVLTLDFGVNTVSGTTSGSNSALGLDFDFFNALFPANSFLHAISLNLTDAGGNGSFVIRLEISEIANFSNKLLQEVVSSGGFFSFPFGLSGDDGFRIGLNSIPSFAINNYTISLDVRGVTTVPEPGTLALMGLGLAGLGLVSRRRRQRR